MFIFLSSKMCIKFYMYLMYNDLFFFLFHNISLILFCQPYCWWVLNPDKLKLFNYLNPGPRNQAQWFIPVCMRLVGEETTLAALMDYHSVCEYKREREREQLKGG